MQVHQNASDRLKLYESDVKVRQAQKAERQKENDFLRQSKKLKALSSSIEKSVSIDMPELSALGDKDTTRTLNGYENKCYDQGELIHGKIESNNNQAIPLKQVIVSVDRITNHLSRLEGKEEESKILHEFFHSEPVQAAIEAIAVHRTPQSQDSKDNESSFTANGTTAHSTKPSEPNVHVVSLYKQEDSYLTHTIKDYTHRRVHMHNLSNVCFVAVSVIFVQQAKMKSQAMMRKERNCVRLLRFYANMNKVNRYDSTRTKRIRKGFLSSWMELTRSLNVSLKQRQTYTFMLQRTSLCLLQKISACWERLVVPPPL
ncbi:unnamed protein product [Nippostrongylus brasiliensis]|uniref:Uncharacterized protein n=1 Tax=Nippostrongylus brasiliensis TaxID=27835 RepID=A0A3P6ZWA8_NIPBR|nr:unnamed protein product [Nippostrongylus brasiliensis]